MDSLNLICDNNPKDSLDAYAVDDRVLLEIENDSLGGIHFTAVILSIEKATRLRDFLTKLIDNLE